MKYLNSYIDNNIIREYAKKTRDGYSLFVSDLDNHEKENLIDILFEHDPATKEFLLSRIEELIEERIPWVETEDNYEKGLTPIHDNQTGEVMWVRRIGGY